METPSIESKLPTYWQGCERLSNDQTPTKYDERGLVSSAKWSRTQSLGFNGCCAWCGSEFVEHSPYSPYLVASDYHLFAIMTKHFTVNQYRSNENILSAVVDIFVQHAENLITNKIHALPQRWTNWNDWSRTMLIKRQLIYSYSMYLSQTTNFLT